MASQMINAERNTDKADGPAVVTRMNFVQEGGGVYYRLAQNATTFKLDQHEVVIHDARPIANELELDRHGFIFVDHPSRVVDLLDTGPAREIYHREMSDLVCSIIGVPEAIVFESAVRLEANAGREGGRGPIHYAHNDYTAETWGDILRQPLNAIRGNADRLLAAPWAIINLWRPIETIESSPLAVCDAQTVRPNDFFQAAALLSPSYPLHRR